jgi:hypothetical protein
VTQAYGELMHEQLGGDEDRVVSVRLDVCLDRQPISGRLRTERGVDEQFVGWLGFVDALKRLNELEGQPGNAERPRAPRASQRGERER